MSTLHFDKNSFETQVEKGTGVALVDFWAPWCGPCKMLGPVIDQISGEVGSKAIVGKINIDENQDVAAKYGVMSIPTVIAFKDGKEVGRSVGLVPKDKLIALINNA